MTSISARTPARSNPRLPSPDDPAELRRKAKDAARTRQIRNGMLSLTGIVVIAGSLLFYWLHSEATARAVQAALDAEQTALRQEVSALDLRDAKQAQQAVQRLEATQKQWRTWPIAAEFADRLGRAQGAVALLSAEHAETDAIDQLEQQLATNPKEVAAWTAMHDRAAALSASAQETSKELGQRLAKCADSIDRGYYAALRASIAAAASDASAARRLLARAEDLAQTRMEAAEHSHDASGRAQWQRDFQACAKEEDALAASTFDAAAIAKVAWQDLLPGTSTADWAHSASLGLDHKVNVETMQIDGPDAGSDRGGVVVLHGHSFRHCELEFDASLVRGAATIVLRAGKKVDPKSAAAVQLVLTPSPKAIQLPSGQPVHFDMLVLGDRLTVHAGAEAQELTIPLQARSGTLGILTEPGTSLCLSHLRVRSLD